VLTDTYVIEKLTGWTPELSPPRDSPLFQWRVLAGAYPPLEGAGTSGARPWSHISLRSM